MKKFWKSLALLLCLLAGFGFVFTACGGGGDDDPELRLALADSKTSITVGESVAITATYDGNDVTADTTFESSDTTKATVSGYTVTGVDAGSVKITGDYNGHKKEITIGIDPKTASAATVAGTYTIGGKTVVIAEDGTVTVDGKTGYTIDNSTGSLVIKDSEGAELYTIGTKSDGTIDTEAVTDSTGAPVTVKELEKSYDGSIFLTLDSEPTYNADSKLYIIQNGATVDTITLDDKYYSINNSKGVIGQIVVKDQLIDYDGDGNVVIVTHTDEKGYAKLYAETTYTVKLDENEIGTYTTKANPTISGNAISVGTDGDFATIQGALNYLRKTEATGDWTITVAEGKYHERLAYYGSANVTIVGASTDNYGSKTVVYWKNTNGWNNGSRMRSNFIWQGGNLTLKNITLKSTNLRSEASKYGDTDSNHSNEVLYFDSTAYLVAYNSSFLGHQDTLILGNSGGRCWFYKDYIEGDVDFIWGYADVALFEDCKIHMTYDDKADSGYIFASRTVVDHEVNKGFVLLNSTIAVDDTIKSYYGRNSNADTQASVIGNTFTGNSVQTDLWKSAATQYAEDVAGDAAIGYKDYNNKFGDTVISTAGRLDKTYDLSKRVANREYNGRWVILNRGFDKTTQAYKTASTIWDVSAYETEFKATEDASKKNVFVEPVATYKVVGGNTVQLSASSVTSDATIKWSLTEETETDNTAATLGSVDENGLVTTTAGAHGKITVTATSSTGATDIAYVYVIPTDIEASAVSLASVTDKEMVLDDVQWITATLETATVGEEVTDTSIEWTAEEGIYFYLEPTSELVATLTTKTPTVGIYAAKTGTVKVTAKSAAYAKATSDSVTFTISDAEKKIGTIPAGGYTFTFLKPDKNSKDSFLQGGDTKKPTLSYNVASTETTATNNALGGKYLTQLKEANRMGVYSTYYDLKSNNTNTISSTEWSKMADSDKDGIPDTDALVLRGVQGPFKVSVVEAKESGSDRYLAIKCGKDDAVVHKSGKYGAQTFKATYEGMDIVDVAIASSNDVYLGSVILEAYNPEEKILPFTQEIDWSKVSSITDTQTNGSVSNVTQGYLTFNAQNKGMVNNESVGYFYYYGNGKDTVLYAGDTANSSAFKSWIEIGADTLASTAGSIELTLNAKKVSGTPRIGIFDADKKVLCVSDLLTDEKANYKLYVAPGKKIYISTIGADGVAWNLYSVSAAESTADKIDTTAPAAVQNVAATAGTESATVTWAEESMSGDFASVLVSYALTSGGTAKTVSVAPGVKTLALSNLEAKEYTVSVYARDSYGNKSTAATATVTPTENATETVTKWAYSDNITSINNAKKYVAQDGTESDTAPSGTALYTSLYADAQTDGANYIQEKITLYGNPTLYVPVYENSTVEIKVKGQNADDGVTVAGNNYTGTTEQTVTVSCSSASAALTELNGIKYLAIKGIGAAASTSDKAYISSITVTTPKN